MFLIIEKIFYKFDLILFAVKVKSLVNLLNLFKLKMVSFYYNIIEKFRGILIFLRIVIFQVVIGSNSFRVRVGGRERVRRSDG